MRRSWRSSWIEIDTDAIVHNINEIKTYIGKEKEIIGVIKDNAYGHGAVEVAKQIISAGVKYLAVATVDEAIELRKYNIRVPILILGYVGKCQIMDIVNYNLSCSLYLEEIAKELSLYALKRDKIAKVHIKINTGMNRIGILPANAVDFLNLIHSLKGLKVEGIFTHFASAAQKDKTFANKQFEIFNNLMKDLKNNIYEPIIIHTANSGATMDMPYSHFTAVRPGRLIYGLYPYPEVEKVIQLRPAMAVRSEIAQINKVNPGEGVGYNGVFRPVQKTHVAILPIGFGDSLVTKRIANKISVIVNGAKKKVVSICADMCWVDLDSSNPNISIGDIVTLIGKQDTEEISIDEFASNSEQSLGELLCPINRRLPRVYLKNDKPYLVQKPFGRFANL